MRTIPAVLAAVAASLLTAAPASAATFGPPQAACVHGIAAGSDGTLYGAGACGDAVTVSVRRPGGSWRTTGPLWRDQHVEAVAADETATYVLMSCEWEAPGCQAGSPLGKEFSIAKLPHGGAPTPRTRLGSSESADSATVAARGGGWWAAWTTTTRDYDVPGSGAQVVLWRKTYGGTGSGVLPVPAEPSGERVFSYDPSIALTGDGAVVAFTSVADREGAPQRLQLAVAGSDGRFVTTPYAPAEGTPATEPDVAYSGGRTFVAWSRAGRPAVAFVRDGVETRTDLPFRGTVGQVSVTASGGRLTVSTAETFRYAGADTRRVYARVLDADGALLSTTELTAAAGRAEPHVGGFLRDSTAARGKATVVYDTGGTPRSASEG